METDVRQAANVLFDYLALRDPHPPVADLIMGFGHFDPKIPRHCGALWRRGLAPRILFTGGVGAGSADLDRPEALYFRDELRRCCPEIPDAAVLVEPTSTHTGQNVTHSVALLREHSPACNFERGIRRVILVANAYRQRRVWLTCRRHLPTVALVNAPPPTTFEEDLALFDSRGQDLIPLLVGELHRIVTYGDRDWIVKVQVPVEVRAATRILEAGGRMQEEA